MAKPDPPSLISIIARLHANSKQKFPVISPDFFFLLLLIHTKKVKTLCSQLIVFAFRPVYDNAVTLYMCILAHGK